MGCLFFSWFGGLRPPAAFAGCTYGLTVTGGFGLRHLLFCYLSFFLALVRKSRANLIMDLRALLIGGVIPAIMIGLTTVFTKLSTRSGISLPIFLCIVGGAILCYGIIATIWSGGEKTVGVNSAIFAIAVGVSWATAILCISYGLSTLAIPVSIVSSLTNSNAPIPIVLGAILFSELKDLNLPRLGVGTLLIIAGAVVVSISMTKSSSH